MKIVYVVGARPNFMKIAPILEAVRAAAQMSSQPVEQRVVHTGQHYTPEMSELFFSELGLPQPDVNLGVGSASHGVQTGQIMAAFDEVLEAEAPDLVVVVGDVNSTVACAIDAAKRLIPVAHVEAGLRSGDRTMPEEINRVLTDAISDLLFTTERSANENLCGEGIPDERIHFVGNVMIDTLLRHKARALERDPLNQLGLTELARTRTYGVITLHRPALVDDPHRFAPVVDALGEIARDVPLLFPAHPRTRSKLTAYALDERLHAAGVRLIEPQGYLDFLNLVANARVVLTDSGGIQEETTILGVPCITLRENTERPVTLTEGTNTLVGFDPEAIRTCARAALEADRAERPAHPELWDGKAGERIAAILLRSVTG